MKKPQYSKTIFSFIIIALFALPYQLFAQPALKMRTFTMLNGLPSNSITMYQAASNGMMWIATWSGLCNYDGYRFNSFVAPMGAGQVLTSNRLRFMVPDDNGDVWLTTFDNRLYLLSSKENRYIDYREKLEELGLKDFEVEFMHNLPNGAVWIFGKNGMNIRIKDGVHEVVPTSTQSPDICHSVTMTPDGNEWLKGEHSLRRYGGNSCIMSKAINVYKTKKGILIAGVKFGRYDMEKEEFTEIPLPKGVESITSSVQTDDNSIVLATNNGVYVYSSSFRKICDFQLSRITKDSKGQIWSMRDDGSAVLITPDKQNTATGFKVKTLTCSIPADWPHLTTDRTIVHEDMDGNVWMLLQGKTMCYYDETSDSLVPIDFRTIGGTSYPEMTIFKVAEDHHKNLWFNCSHNTCMLTFTNHSFHHVPLRQSEETRAVFADSNGRFWAGTRHGYLAVINSDGAVLGYLTPKGTLSPSPVQFDKEGIYTIYEDKHHRLWIGSRGNGLFLLQSAVGGNSYSVTHFTQDNSNICGNDFYDIYADVTDRLWFATYTTGLMYLNENAGATDGKPQTISSQAFVSAQNCNSLALPDGDIQKVRRINYAKDGTLLFSTADGLLTINPRFKLPTDIRIFTSKHNVGDTTALLSRDVMQTLTCKKNNRIYVATMGGGIQTIESSNLKQNNLRFKQLTDIPINIGNIQSMIEDHNGKVWIVGENCILNLNPDGSIGQMYSANDLGRNVEFTEAKPCFNQKNNSIIVGTMGGAIIFRPDDIRQTDFVPSLVFTGIQYQGDEGVTPLIGNREIELPTDKHNAVVYFAALDYSDNSQIRYAYRIKELESKWSYVGSEHCAPLSNMPSGHYTLEVRSTNSDGIWVDNNAELKIYVVPTFWQTPWAWIIYLILTCLLLYGVIYMFQLRNAHRIEKEINERQLRFFTDISHQLRTPLTLISGPVSAVLNTETLSEKAVTYLRYVESNANKMLEIVNKSLSLSKLQKLNQEMYEIPNPESSTNPIYSITPINPNTSINPNISTIFEDLTILIVEDNDELRYFLSTSLSTHYNIIEARNGEIGLNLAAEKQPDFIITDIMMPEMDGITMIRHIKADQNISHIPIIILSARTADIYRIEGLKEGADDYITKPFSVSYLQVRVESIVRQRRMLQETWRKSLQTQSPDAPQAEEMPPSSLSKNDQHFTEALTSYINDNISNVNLKIDDIAHAMSVSRSVLYGKTKTIYGLSPNDMLRNMRMDRACKMLREDFNKTVAEIAYAVGFNEPKYFARSFKQCFGKTPTEYRKSNE